MKSRAAATLNILPQIEADLGMKLPSHSVLSFSVLKGAHSFEWPPGSGPIQFETSVAVALLKLLAEKVFVDEGWYRDRYPDIDAGIISGNFANARHHYVEFGYFEDRQPHYIEVNDDFYCAANPDVVYGIELGVIKSSQEHFERYGFREGRLPYAGWQLVPVPLTSNPQN
jgi:hypothetical protein